MCVCVVENVDGGVRSSSLILDANALIFIINMIQAGKVILVGVRERVR